MVHDILSRHSDNFRVSQSTKGIIIMVTCMFCGYPPGRCACKYEAKVTVKTLETMIVKLEGTEIPVDILKEIADKFKDYDKKIERMEGKFEQYDEKLERMEKWARGQTIRRYGTKEEQRDMGNCKDCSKPVMECVCFTDKKKIQDIPVVDVLIEETKAILRGFNSNINPPPSIEQVIKILNMWIMYQEGDYK